jgi:choline monooxygenase
MTDLAIDSNRTQELGGVRTRLPLAPRAYTAPSAYERELEAIFAHSWVHVADTPDLVHAGDFVTAQVGDTPVVIVRGHDGELRGFLNACRHRGATVAEGQGNCGKQLRCPYHAWSYGCDGKLIGVPFRDEFPSLDGLDLIPVRIAVMAPLVFACLDARAPSFDAWAGELVGALTRAHGHRMNALPAFDYEVRANWKVGVENALDGYHVPVVHDVLANIAPDLRGATNHEEPFSSSTRGKIAAPFLSFLPNTDHLTEQERGEIRFGFVFPNIIPVLFPGTLVYAKFEPVAVDRLRLRTRAFDVSGASADAVQFRQQISETTNRQDIAVIERVQRGLNARNLPPAVYASHLESRIQHFQGLVMRALAG